MSDSNSTTSGGGSNLLSKMKNLLNNKWTIFYVIISLAIFVALGYYVYQNYVEPKIKPKYVENRELIQDPNEVNYAKLYIFVTEWCPHSKAIMAKKGAWEKIKNDPDLKEINNFTLQFIEINGDDDSRVSDFETKYLEKSKKIDGFPTIILIKDKQVIEFDANPTYETLKKFLETVI